MPMLCEGCGLELPDRAPKPGRRPRFHNDRCRQRAHRARVAGGRAEVLGELEAVAGAVNGLRRAVLTGAQPRAATVETLRRATAAVAAALESPPSEQAPAEQTGGDRVPAAPLPVKHIVTEPVTEPVTESVAAVRATVAELPTARPAARRRAKIDPDTVRLRERGPGVHDVLAGPPDAPVTLGRVTAVYGVTGKPKSWKASGVDGRGGGVICKTRAAAVADVVIADEARRQRHAERQRRARRIGG